MTPSRPSFRRFPAAKPNIDLTATVTQILKGGNHPVAPGSAILYARGNAATRLAAEAAVGASLTVRMILPSPFSTAVAGIGGGPLLVKNGKPVFRSNESFATSWLIPRTARTAVGQRADGSILLVVVDGGRPGSSVGMTNFELAQKLAGLGAVTAMALDGGTSSTMAFDGELLNKPSQGEKPIADALALLYTGVQADPGLARRLRAGLGRSHARPTSSSGPRRCTRGCSGRAARRSSWTAASGRPARTGSPGTERVCRRAAGRGGSPRSTTWDERRPRSARSR